MGNVGGHAPLGVLSGGGDVLMSPRVDRGSPVSATRTRAGRSVPFELVEAPQRQASVAGAVAEGRLGLNAADIAMNTGVVSAQGHHGSKQHERIESADIGHMRVTKSLDSKHSRNETEEVFHDMYETGWSRGCQT
jgi:hypothetical protein